MTSHFCRAVQNQNKQNLFHFYPSGRVGLKWKRPECFDFENLYEISNWIRILVSWSWDHRLLSFSKRQSTQTSVREPDEQVRECALSVHWARMLKSEKKTILLIFLCLRTCLWLMCDYLEHRIGIAAWTDLSSNRETLSLMETFARRTIGLAIEEMIGHQGRVAWIDLASRKEWNGRGAKG